MQSDTSAFRQALISLAPHGPMLPFCIALEIEDSIPYKTGELSRGHAGVCRKAVVRLKIL
jgi:hypothetical protein